MRYLYLMYNMPYFKEKDRTTILRFMKNNAFVTLIGSDGERSVATQVPVIVSEGENGISVRGHIMRKTDHHRAFEKNNQVLVMFQGPQCYISASWYMDRGHGSTWNYMTVHLRGNMRMMEETETIQLLTDLTHLYEGPQEKPELVENLDRDYIVANVKAIAGFEIIADSIDAIFKLSQNRDDETYINIVNKLKQSDECGAQKIAEEMIIRRAALFSGK